MMDADRKLLHRIRAICREDHRFSPEAYGFVQSVVAYCQARLNEGGAPRHITGPELLEGFREHAIEEFGPFTRHVLRHWGIESTRDVGQIVFKMVDHDLLGASDEDSPRDFAEIYDFDEAFVAPYRPERVPCTPPVIDA